MFQERRIPFLEIVSEEELHELHASALELLERTGINVYHQQALQLLDEAGARVEGKRVRIPPQLVKWALNSVPERAVLSSRMGERRMFLERGRTYFGTGSDLKHTIDLYTGEKRLSLLDDVKNAALLCNELDNIDFIMSYGLASDVKATSSELHQFYTMAKYNHTKPMILTSFEIDIETLKKLYRIACLVRGGEEELQANPFIILYGQFVSPFQHNVEGLDRLLFCAEKRIPIIYVPTVMAGASGPVTMAGSLALANAETLAGLVISQLKAEGSPFIYGGCVMPFDMKEAVRPYGSPDWSMGDAVLTQLSRYYGLPVFATGGCSDSAFVDGQAAMEGCFSALMGALCGANLVHDVGYLEQGLTGSLEYIVMMNEAIGMSKRVLKGFKVDKESLALDLIDRIGPGGHFTGEEHTYRHFKNVTWYPEVIERRGGSEPMEERARKRAREILKEAEPQPVPEEIDREVQGILKSVETE